MTTLSAVAPTTGDLRHLVDGRTVDEVLRGNHERARFVIEGLVHATTTLVYGLSEAGKSWLMVSLVTALADGQGWLGQPLNGGPRRCLVLGADAGAQWEYAERLGGGFGDRILLGSPPPARVDLWENLGRESAAEGIGLVVVDNLYAWAGSVDVNSNAEVAGPLGCLGVVAEAGVAVALVHHTNSAGRKPAGVHSIPAFFRHSLGVHKATMRSHGNDAPEITYRLKRDGGRIIDAVPKQKAEVAQAPEGAPANERGRSKTRQRYEEAVRLLQAAPPPYSQHALGEYLMHRMDSVPTKGSGRGLVRAVTEQGMWSPPAG